MSRNIVILCCVMLCGFFVSTLQSARATENEDVIKGTEVRAAEIYTQTCIVCHAEGVGGAPRPGLGSDWQSRLEYGMEELYYNTIKGLGAAMPPRGLCGSCSDDELEATVDYMLHDLKSVNSRSND